MFPSGFSWPADKDMPSVPWDNLSSHPDVYYDTSLFCLPTCLTLPQLYLTSPPDVYALIGYFAKSPRPFIFWPKSEIIRRSTLQVEQEETTRVAGDEVEEEPVELPQRSSNKVPVPPTAETPLRPLESPQTIVHNAESITPRDSVILSTETPNPMATEPQASLAVPFTTPQSVTVEPPSTAMAGVAPNNAPGVAQAKKQSAHTKGRSGPHAQSGNRKSTRKRDKPDTESAEIVAQSGSSGKKRKKG
jgi:hypothetical protein